MDVLVEGAQHGFVGAAADGANDVLRGQEAEDVVEVGDEQPDDEGGHGHHGERPPEGEELGVRGVDDQHAIEAGHHHEHEVGDVHPDR